MGSERNIDRGYVADLRQLSAGLKLHAGVARERHVAEVAYALELAADEVGYFVRQIEGELGQRLLEAETTAEIVAKHHLDRPDLAGLDCQCPTCVERRARS